MDLFYYLFQKKQNSGAVVDATLTKHGQAADAAVVGQKFDSLSEEISNCVIAPTIAAVGQTIQVTAIDEDGKPTEWEAVDFPEQAQSNWDQNDDSKPDFVKNRPFYETIDSVTLMPETQFSNLTHIYNPDISTPSDVNGAFIDDFTSYGTVVKTGDQVKVTFDGTVYECVKQGVYIGNQSLMNYDGVEDTGEPFLFSLDSIPSFHTKSTDCVVKVEADISHIKKIDSKFLELPIAPGSGTNSTIENCVANYGGNIKNTANGEYSHAEGSSNSADGECSHAEGYGCTAKGKYQHVQGRFNKGDTYTNQYAHIVGNGTDDDNRSNAHTLDWYGNAWFAGSVECTSIILKSSTAGSTKMFRLTVDDNGTIGATQI